MTKNTPAPPIAAVPIGMDIARVEAALRELATTAVAEEARVTAQYGDALPDFANHPSAQAIIAPVATACRAAYAKLADHLANLIGYRAASEICGRIAHDVQDESAAFAAQPSTARH